jgi:tetratricopeptide (TPR) repeat protein
MSIHPPALLCAAIAAATVAGLLSTGPAAEAAAPKPDLGVKSAKVDKTSITEGKTLTVTHVVQNQGKASAKSSVTRFYLTTDVAASLAARKAGRTNPRSSLTDILLEGSASVARVKPGRSTMVAKVELRVPVGTPADSYTVLACADDRGTVTESNEADNCTPATTDLQIKEEVGSDDLSVQAFSETYRWPDSEQSSLQYVKIFCEASYPVKSYTLSSALASVRSELERLAPGGLAMIDSSGLASTPEKAQELAGAALTRGSPGLALAALLKAHTLEPGRGTHLVNAAALATSVSLPNQALAFLDAAVSRDFLRPALGIPHQATAAVIRGQALVMTGRYDAAQQLFVQAKQLAPILSEADTGLATVAACKGQDALAARYLRRARVRSDEPVPPTPPTQDPAQPEPNIDVTRGEAVPLRQLPIAETPAQGAEMNDVYDGIARGFEAEIQANIDETGALEQHLRDTDGARTPAEIDRRDSIFVLLYRTHLEADIENAHNALDDKIDELVLHGEEFWGGGTGEQPYIYNGLVEDASAVCAGSDVPNCFEIEINRTCRPELARAHNEWRTLISEAQNLANKYFRIESKLMSGYAANLIDEEAHRLALLHIDSVERDVYAGLVGQAQHWTRSEKLFSDHCVDPLPAEILNPPANIDVESPGKCEGALKAMNLRATLGPTTIKISCERVEQGFSAEIIPLLHVFVDVKFDFRTGNVSVWAGSKGGGTVANVVEAGFKSGIYVKVDGQGELVDTGWRVGPSVSVGAGAAEFGAYDNEIDLSFTSSLTPGY